MAQEDAFRVTAGERQLFLDDYGIAKMDNLIRTLHQPAKKGAVIRPVPGDSDLNCIQTRTAPIWDPEKKVWKFWDITIPNSMYEKGVYCSGYYESSDGLHWTKPVVGKIEYKGSRQNNLISVAHKDKGMMPGSVVYDPTDPDPSRRFKAVLPHTGFAVSADGVNWTALNIERVPCQDEFNLSFDSKDHLFILTVKRSGPYGRSVALMTSKDFEHWTDHDLIFHADEIDQELGKKNIERVFADPSLAHPAYNMPEKYNVDIYNMGLFRYEGLYIGLPSVYHKTGQVDSNWPGFAEWDVSPAVMQENYLKSGDWGGFHHVQMICGRDFKNWQRIGDRKPFIDLSPVGAGAYDLACIIGPSYPIVRGDELWFYYTGIKQYGGPPPTSAVERDTGAICLAVLRRDGFISLDAGDEEGTLLTKPFQLTGGKLYTNIDARKGELRVEALDKDGEILAMSSPLNGDLPRGEVNWRQGNLADPRGHQVSFRFFLRNAKLYSYWLEK